jgi:multicomponent Na+:H+ antiporter subunit E
MLTWVVLTWTLTLEQEMFGVGLAIVVAISCLRLGDVVPPWRILDPRRTVALVRLVLHAAARVVAANVSLARRVWRPSMPLRPGMVIVPTRMRSDGGLTAVGLITSVIVDNQIVDLDRRRHELQYHAVWIASEDPDENAKEINAPVEERLRAVMRAP